MLPPYFTNVTVTKGVRENASFGHFSFSTAWVEDVPATDKRCGLIRRGQVRLVPQGVSVLSRTLTIWTFVTLDQSFDALMIVVFSIRKTASIVLKPALASMAF